MISLHFLMDTYLNLYFIIVDFKSKLLTNYHCLLILSPLHNSNGPNLHVKYNPLICLILKFMKKLLITKTFQLKKIEII